MFRQGAQEQEGMKHLSHWRPGAAALKSSLIKLV
jgi:hypothetical protein